MTETTAAPGETVPTLAEPSEWPLAEETLKDHPDVSVFWTSPDRIAALEAAPDVVVQSGIRANFDRDLESYGTAYDDQAHATADSLWADADARTREGSRPLPADPLPDDDEREARAAEAQHDAEASLDRWSKGTRLADPEIAPEDVTEVTEGVVLDGAP